MRPRNLVFLAINLLAMAALYFGCVRAYSHLPERIVRHANLAGVPDAWVPRT